MHAGHGLVVRHFRENEECGALEELPPIDENRQYDFNFQQVTHLPREVKILPVSYKYFAQTFLLLVPKIVILCPLLML